MDIYTQYVGTKYRAVRIRDIAPPEPCARIGGFPPAGITVPIISGYERYFLTLPLTEHLCVSAFLAIDYDHPDSEFYYFQTGLSHCFHDEKVFLVRFVIHDFPSSKYETAMASEIPPLFLVQEGQPAEDPIITKKDDLFLDELNRDHKTGGVPWYNHPPDEFVFESLRIMDKGYRHILQLECPSSDDSKFDVTWPFGEDVFHIFGKPNSDKTKWTFLYSWG